MQIVNESQAVELFRQAAITQADAIEAGNYQIGNKALKQIANSLRWLEVHHAMHLLNSLLKAPEVGVRLWAASCLLLKQHPAAEETLEIIASKSDINGLTAATTLREWRAGRLKSLLSTQ